MKSYEPMLINLLNGSIPQSQLQINSKASTWWKIATE